MANEQTIVAVSNAVVAVLPSVIGMIQSLFKQQNPGVPVPTSAEVTAAFADACTKSLSVDADWLASHPIV